MRPQQEDEWGSNENDSAKRLSLAEMNKMES